MFISNKLGLLESTETMLAQTQRLNQVTNNLANIDTSGYKREDITFWEMLYTANDNRQRVGKALKLVTNQDQGSAEVTGNPLDFMISGDGFFRIQTPDGIRYSRAGRFTTNSQGQMVTPQGHLVLGEGGPIVINGDDISVSQDGTFLVDNQTVGRLAIAAFADGDSLEKDGTNLFRLSDTGQEIAAANFQIQQGSLEGSNVNTVSEMANMLKLHRAYETQQKVIRTFDEMDSKAINSVGKLT
ncbi:MAG: flagellar basal-body rod protein FlgF [Desulfobulbaceae bacterium]|uniref:Flagellar basal-body rod protein FlgF n=1 Tax=Candidatus Desulfobia pelagia TaxID=2841692 RepID=A0A8J6NEC8_9BACT|nr:flagellar basal-body rod protein FlgF [Candidatus Desulfobia pelagia]